MTKFICNKCKKEFGSKYNLERHYNRKIPCFINETTCKRCLKQFKSKYLLDKHIKKRISCESYKKKDKNQSDILSTTYNKDNKNDSKTDTIKLKLEIEKEKSNQKEIDAKKEEMRMQHEKEMKMLELEMLKIKFEKNIEIEHMKTERKEKTVSIINNIETINIHNNFVQYIENKYILNEMLTIDSPYLNSGQMIKKTFKNYFNNLEFNCYLYNLCKSSEEFAIIFLKILFTAILI